MFTGKIRVLAGAINCNLFVSLVTIQCVLAQITKTLTLKFQVFAIGFDIVFS